MHVDKWKKSKHTESYIAASKIGIQNRSTFLQHPTSNNTNIYDNTIYLEASNTLNVDVSNASSYLIKRDSQIDALNANENHWNDNIVRNKKLPHSSVARIEQN